MDELDERYTKETGEETVKIFNCAASHTPKFVNWLKGLVRKSINEIKDIGGELEFGESDGDDE